LAAPFPATETLVAVANYVPGGLKVFRRGNLDGNRLDPGARRRRAHVETLGLVAIPGRRFIYSLYDAGEIWIADFGESGAPAVTKFPNAGLLPYDGNVTSDGRHYLAGLFGEDGFAHLDLWSANPKIERVLQGYNTGREKIPVYKMPHLEGWGQSANDLVLPAAGQHEALVLDLQTMREKKRIPVHGQPIFCVARPDGREVWMNFGLPLNDTVQIVDIPSLEVVHSFTPGPTVLHLEFTPRGHEVWISVRDADRVDVMDVRSRAKVAEIPAQKPSGIFLTARAHKL